MDGGVDASRDTDTAGTIAGTDQNDASGQNDASAGTNPRRAAAEATTARI